MEFQIISPLSEGFFIGKSYEEGFEKKTLPMSKDSILVALPLRGGVGFACFCLFRELPDGVIEIDYISTHQSYRKKGLARRCLNWILKEKSPERVWLEVSTLNLEAVSFYEKFGFKKEALRKNYYGSGVDAFLYTLNLQKH